MKDAIISKILIYDGNRNMAQVQRQTENNLIVLSIPVDTFEQVPSIRKD